MTDRTPQSDTDVIREARRQLSYGGGIKQDDGLALLAEHDRLLALLAEKDAQIDLLRNAPPLIRSVLVKALRLDMTQPPVTAGELRFAIDLLGDPPSFRRAVDGMEALMRAERELDAHRQIVKLIERDAHRLNAHIDRLAAQVRTLTEALDWLRFSLGSWAVYRERQPCAVFDSNEHRDVLDRIQSALASVQQPPAEEQT